MTSRKTLLSVALSLLAVGAAGCNGGGNTPPPPPAGISVVFNPAPTTSMVVGTKQTLTVVVNNDGAGAGVTWSVSCQSSACGTLSSSTTPGNNPSTTYTAPAQIPTGNNVIITATSVSDTTKSTPATIKITAAPAPPLADGTYIFHLSGEDVNASPYFAAGAFTIQNGVISAGEEDALDLGGGGTFSISPNGSSISTAADGNVQIVLNAGANAPGVNGVQTLRGTAVSSTRLLISEFDTFAAGTGSLDLQTSKNAPSAGYAFSLGGVDNEQNPEPMFLGGILNINGTSISVANSVFDVTDGADILQKQVFTAGSVSAPDSYGRVSINLNLTYNTVVGPKQLGLAGYIVGPNTIRLVELYNDTAQCTLGGTGLGQGSNTNNFDASRVGGNTYVFIATGADINSLANFAGGFALNSTGTVSGNLAYSDTAVGQGPTITSGNWTVDTTGRVTLSNVTVTSSNTNITGPFTFQLYLDGNGNAMELGLDNFQGTTGPAFVQSGDVASGNYAIAAQGFANYDGLPVWAAVGPITLDSSLNWSGFTDYNVAVDGTPAENMTLSGTTDTTDGLFSIYGLNAVTPTPSTPEFGYYPVDANHVIAIEVDNNQLGIFVIESTNNPQP